MLINILLSRMPCLVDVIHSNIGQCNQRLRSVCKESPDSLESRYYMSLNRIRASRANGARSRGPITPQGKANSSRNSLRHGLLAKAVLVGKESPESFRALCELLAQRFAPVDDLELGMLEEMAASFWRLRRAWAMESEMLSS